MRNNDVFLASALLIIIVLSVVLAALIYMPTSADYSIYNVDWNGFSKILEYDIVPSYSISMLLEKGAGTLIILPVETPLDANTSRDLLLFVEKGGTLIILTEGNQSEPLLRLLGGIEVINRSVLDYTYHYKSPLLPYGIVSYNGERFKVVLNVPKYLKLFDKAWHPFIVSSNFSFIDINGNNIKDDNDLQGSFVIAAYRRYGLGTVYVIADLDVFINSMLKFDGNVKLLEILRDHAMAYLCLSNIRLPLIDRIKAILSSQEIPSFLHPVIALLITIVFSIFNKDLIKKKSDRSVVPIIALVYSIIVSTMVLLYEVDLSIIIYLITISLFIITGLYGLASLIIASLIMYMGSSQFFPLYIPLILLYPLINKYSKTTTQYLWIFGSTNTFTLQILGVLSPLAIIYPPSVIPLTYMLASLLAFAIIGYISLSKIMIEGPIDIIQTTPIEEIRIPLIIRNAKNVFMEIELLDFKEILIVQEDGIITVPLKLTRIGYHKLKINVFIEDSNGFSFMKKYIPLEVNVVPSVEHVLQILEKYMRGLKKKLVPRYSAEAGGRRITVYDIGYEAVYTTVKTKYTTIVTTLMSMPTNLKARRGEYHGTREYIPGDNPKNIHWKKSLSKRELIVKEYTSGNLSGRDVYSYPLIVFSDLYASNIEEFDKTTYKLITTLIRYAALSPSNTLIVFMALPNGIVRIVRGEAKTVLLEVLRVLREELLYVDIRYDSMNTELSDKELTRLFTSTNALITLIKNIHVDYGKNILKMLNYTGITPPAYFTIINARSTAFKYSVLKYLLKNSGYEYISPREISVSGRELQSYASMLAMVA